MNEQDWTDWVKRENNYTNMTGEEAEQMNDLCEEIIRLQERVRALEREQMYPNNAFWGQFLYDIVLFLFMIWTVVNILGR